MPKYSYKCKKCENIINVFHSMSKALTDCAACNTNNSLVRLPSSFFYDSGEKQQKVGDLVEKAIKDFRTDLEEEKSRARKEEWSTDD